LAFGDPALRTVARLAARLPVGVDRRWPVLRGLKRALLQRLRREVVVRDGLTVHLDATDSLRLGMGDEHEPDVCRFLAAVLRPGDRAVDGGAHVGYLSLRMARAVGPSGEVHAFEPDPTSFRLLELNAVANGLSTIMPVQAALWSSCGTARLYVREDHHADHRLWDPGDGRPSVEVATVTLDRHFAGDDRPLRLVKLDVQGAELHALRGMERLLERDPGLILLLELWPRGLRGCGSDPQELVALLRRAGRGTFRPGADGGLVPVEADRVLVALDPASRLGRLRAGLRRRAETELVCLPAGLDPEAALGRGRCDVGVSSGRRPMEQPAVQHRP